MKNRGKLGAALSAVAAACCTLFVIGLLGYMFREHWIIAVGPDPSVRPSSGLSGDSADSSSGGPASGQMEGASGQAGDVPGQAGDPSVSPEADPSGQEGDSGSDPQGGGQLPQTGPEMSASGGQPLEKNPDPPPERPAPDPNVAYQSLYPDLYAAPGRMSEEYPGTIFLTFDDGPSQNTAQVLDILQDHDVRATFFVVTGREELPGWKADLLRRIVDEGHTLGLHSSTHEFRSIYASVESYLDDFSTASDLIYNATGVRPWVFRFPGGTKNSYNQNTYRDICAEMDRRGFVHYDWNCSAQDASNTVTAGEIWRNMTRDISPDRRNVLLMHDTKSLTVGLLDAFLTEMESQGYTFAPLSPDVKPVNWY